MIDKDKFHLKKDFKNSEEDDDFEYKSKEEETVEYDLDVEETEETSEDIIEKEQLIEIKQEEFNWDTIDKKSSPYSTEERREMENMYEETFKNVAEKDVIEGTIVQKTNREVVVDIGYKSEGIIPLAELRYNPDIKVGDKIDVFVESLEDRYGQLVLSHKKARSIVSWDKVNKVHETGEIIKGYIKCRTKGGMIVDVFGIEAFLPGSQIDVKPVHDYDIFVGKTMDFKIVKVSHEFKNVVVSHKALIEEELKKQRADIISKLEKGQILEGVVKNITVYGVFIDLGGVDGLIHITDLAWGRIKHPEEIIKLDQKINVVILDFDEEKKRIALGLKQLQPHPWDTLDADLKVGDKIKGTIVSVFDYGAFVEIKNGVEGLIHVSEMSWSQHLRTAHDFVKVGDEVEVIVLILDREERKMSLSMKQLKPDPWINIEEKYKIGTQHKAIVRNFTNFGIFVELEEGIDGLIHVSDLSWLKRINHPSEFTQIGAPIEVKVLEVDKENRRLGLGHKQIEENPWDVFETVFTIGSIHKGTVTSFEENGANITLPYGVEAFAATKQLVKEDRTQTKVNETLDFKVIEFLREGKRIIVSHSKVWQDRLEEEALTKELEKKSTKQKKSPKKDKKKEQSEGEVQSDTRQKIKSKEENKEEKSKKKVQTEDVTEDTSSEDKPKDKSDESLPAADKPEDEPQPPIQDTNINPEAKEELDTKEPDKADKSESDEEQNPKEDNIN